MEIKTNEPTLTQKHFSKQLVYSGCTIKRYRDDINMDSPSNRKKHKKKTTKLNTPNYQLLDSSSRKKSKY